MLGGIQNPELEIPGILNCPELGFPVQGAKNGADVTAVQSAHLRRGLARMPLARMPLATGKRWWEDICLERSSFILMLHLPIFMFYFVSGRFVPEGYCGGIFNLEVKPRQCPFGSGTNFPCNSIDSNCCLNAMKLHASGDPLVSSLLSLLTAGKDRVHNEADFTESEGLRSSCTDKPGERVGQSLNTQVGIGYNGHKSANVIEDGQSREGAGKLNVEEADGMDAKRDNDAVGHQNLVPSGVVDAMASGIGSGSGHGGDHGQASDDDGAASKAGQAPESQIRDPLLRTVSSTLDHVRELLNMGIDLPAAPPLSINLDGTDVGDSVQDHTGARGIAPGSSQSDDDAAMCDTGNDSCESSADASTELTNANKGVQRAESDDDIFSDAQGRKPVLSNQGDIMLAHEALEEESTVVSTSTNANAAKLLDECHVYSLPTKASIGSNVIGIDLGNEKSTLSVVGDDGAADIIKNSFGDRSTPSWFTITQSEEPLHPKLQFGKMASKRALKGLNTMVRDIKDMIMDHGARGQCKEDQGALWRSRHSLLEKGKQGGLLLEAIHSPHGAAASLLRHLKDSVEIFLPNAGNSVVLAVPSFFSSRDREIMLEAAIAAGLNVVKLVHDSTAVGLMYSLFHHGQQNVVVIDVGEASLDIGVMRIESGGRLSVLGSGGTRCFGGRNFDWSLAQHIAEVIPSLIMTNNDDGEIDFTSWMNLLREARRIKHELSVEGVTEADLTYVDNDGREHTLTVSRQKLDNLTRTIIEFLMDELDRALQTASLSKRDVDRVLLVGGASRLPTIPDMISSYFEHRADVGRHGMDADESVSHGAAVVASLHDSRDVRRVYSVETDDIRYRERSSIAYYLDMSCTGVIGEPLFDTGTPLPALAVVNMSAGEDSQHACIYSASNGLQGIYKLEDGMVWAGAELSKSGILSMYGRYIEGGGKTRLNICRTKREAAILRHLMAFHAEK